MADPAEAQAPPLNELELARAVAAGMLPSGHNCGGYRLWRLRISGTGLAARPALGEIALRDADTWLSPEMIERCRALPITVEHPASGTLDSAEFAARIVGMIVWPYIANNELWGIGKVFDADANEALAAGACSTSPSVSFSPGDGGQTLELGNGQRLNLEGDPYRLDHLALVPDAGGVWDRGISGRGVRSDSNQPGDTKMSETMMDGAPPDAVMAALSKLTDCLTGMAAKQDAMSGRLDGICSRMDGLEAAAAKPAAGDLPGSPTQVAADGASQANPNGTGPELTRYEEDRRRGAAMAKLAEESLEKEREATRQRVEAQSRADKACVAFGERAPPPMLGEQPLSYRKRLLRPFRKYSPDYAQIDVDAVTDAAMFNVIEQRVYSDAIAASERGDHIPEDMLVATTRNIDGHQIVTWRGRKTFISGMKPPTMRAKFLAVPHTNNQPA